MVCAEDIFYQFPLAMLCIVDSVVTIDEIFV